MVRRVFIPVVTKYYGLSFLIYGTGVICFSCLTIRFGVVNLPFYLFFSFGVFDFSILVLGYNFCFLWSKRRIGSTDINYYPPKLAGFWPKCTLCFSSFQGKEIKGSQCVGTTYVKKKRICYVQMYICVCGLHKKKRQVINRHTHPHCKDQNLRQCEAR